MSVLVEIDGQKYFQIDFSKLIHLDRNRTNIIPNFLGSNPFMIATSAFTRTIDNVNKNRDTICNEISNTLTKLSGINISTWVNYDGLIIQINSDSNCGGLITNLTSVSMTINSKFKQQFAPKCVEIGNTKIYHYPVKPIVDAIIKEKVRYIAAETEKKIQLEEIKLNTLFVAGELSNIGYPVDHVTFSELNTVIDVKIPVDRKSQKTRNFVRLNIRKTKKKIKEITADTKLDISFVKDTDNRNQKVVTFDNITLADALIILESFKKVYFKEEEDDNNTN